MSLAKKVEIHTGGAPGPYTRRESSWVKSLLAATLVSGTLDAIAGVVVFDFILGKMSIVQILQWIGSGVFGAKAFEMGLTGAAYGTLFHYVIAFGFSAGLFAVYRSFTVLRDYPRTSGLFYGALIWAAMNFVILPYFSAVQHTPIDPLAGLLAFSWHMVLVGLPIVLIARRHFERT